MTNCDDNKTDWMHILCMIIRMSYFLFHFFNKTLVTDRGGLPVKICDMNNKELKDLL